MKKLYPLKFTPVPQKRVWGGDALATQYGKPFEKGDVVGESWEISGFEDESSVIANGFLEKNSLYDVVETYMGDLVGDDIFKYFGNEFPLLVKLLDINDRLSVQVHPDDETAFDRHNSYGKSEAWYILESAPDSIIYMGFNRDVSPTEFYQRCKEGTLEEVLNVYHPQKGDFFYIESGIVHSAGGGLVIAEVQQLSDVTYRIYDWGRENNPATARQMHLEAAFDSINYSKYDPVKYFVPAGDDHKEKRKSVSTPLTRNIHFSMTLFELYDSLHIYPEKFQSFILYCCVEGSAAIGTETLSKGEWVLIPATYEDFFIAPSPEGVKLIEVHIEPIEEETDSYISDEHCHDEHCHDEHCHSKD